MSFRRTACPTFFRRLASHVFVIVLSVPIGAWAGEAIPDIEVFVRAGCSHCEAAKTFLDELRQEQPSLRIVLSDIAEDPAARQRLTALAENRGLTTIGVPTFLIGTEILVGFHSSDTTGAEIRARLDQRTQGDAVLPAAGGIKTAWFGELRARDLGLPLFTIVIGLLDGFNPCAMWVLLFLLSLLVNLQNRRKMALIAGTFVLVSGMIYFAFMAAWLKLYNLAYILDDSLMVTIAVITVSRRKLSYDAGRWLKLTRGAVMFSLGLVLILKPEWLTF